MGKYIYEIYLRIIYTFLGIIWGICIGYIESDIILCMLVEPLESICNYSVIYFDITEGFKSKIKLSVLVGVFFTFPLFWIQVVFFMSPALYKKELKFLCIWVSISSIFLLISFFFVKDSLLPKIWSFFLSFQGDSVYYPSLIPYLEILFEIFALLLISSQIPLFLYILVYKNWLKKDFFIQNRKSFILILLIFGALITPPDLLSLILVFLPLILFYELFVYTLLVEKFLFSN